MAVTDYNELETKLAKEENRKPELMPKITPHVLRHCFCSRLIEAGLNAKEVQELMGHSSYQTTMNIYADISPSLKTKALQEAEGKFKIL